MKVPCQLRQVPPRTHWYLQHLSYFSLIGTCMKNKIIVFLSIFASLAKSPFLQWRIETTPGRSPQRIGTKQQRVGTQKTGTHLRCVNSHREGVVNCIDGSIRVTRWHFSIFVERRGTTMSASQLKFLFFPNSKLLETSPHSKYKSSQKRWQPRSDITIKWINGN